MSHLTRFLIVLIAVAIPVTSASAAKYGRPRTSDDATARTQRTAAPNRGTQALDTPAVEALRNADREDLNLRQMATLASEVDRLRQMENKAQSDGELSTRDAEKLYETAVRSCQKVMTPTSDGTAESTRGRHVNSSRQAARTRRRRNKGGYP